ncbi:MAG: FMN-binding protein [Anaerolinea sp.]|nr:FMN-binding protein [Anaerolinea sp.]
MNTSKRSKQIKALGASVLVVASAVGGVNALSSSVPVSDTPDTPVGQEIPGRPGRPGGGARHNHLEGMDTNPPEVELAPAESEVEPTQSTTLVEGADYYDGTYYGDAVRAGRWGTMQVVAVIENGELVDVLIASYPNSTYESDIITRNALPTLISEAIEAQDADVDFVSRATDSSRAFVASLESALLDAAIGLDL